MENSELSIMVSSLKAQVNILEAKVKQLQAPAEKKKFADFYGCLSGLSESTEEEINAVKFMLKESTL